MMPIPSRRRTRRGRRGLFRTGAPIAPRSITAGTRRSRRRRNRFCRCIHHLTTRHLQPGCIPRISPCFQERQLIDLRDKRCLIGHIRIAGTARSTIPQRRLVEQEVLQQIVLDVYGVRIHRIIMARFNGHLLRNVHLVNCQCTKGHMPATVDMVDGFPQSSTKRFHELHTAERYFCVQNQITSSRLIGRHNQLKFHNNTSFLQRY